MSSGMHCGPTEPHTHASAPQDKAGKCVLDQQHPLYGQYVKCMHIMAADRGALSQHQQWP